MPSILASYAHPVVCFYHREEKLYGDDIIDAMSVFSYSTDHNDTPPVQSNNVSFMKVEQLPFNCRSILAAGESHICYSVTQKKNLLRLIDTVTGEKALLRGHESAVLDLRFSPADNRCLCSVDAESIESAAVPYASPDSKPHTIVWEKQEQGDWKTTAELPLKAW